MFKVIPYFLFYTGVMMEIICLKSKFMKGRMQQNTYILKGEKSAIAIDAGAEVEDVVDVLGGLPLKAVLMTHLHFDHFWNIEKYINNFNCNVFICEGFQEKFGDYYKNGAVIVRENKVCNIDEKNIKCYQEKLKIDDFEVEVYFTPGHSADCVCIKIEKALFSGDTLFADGIGRTDLYDSDNFAMKQSLKLIKELDFEMFYPGHYDKANKDVAENIIAYVI